MVRARLSERQIERGRQLGRLLRQSRGARTAVEIAAAAGVSVETVRKIEHGAIPTPAFFTIVALAAACGVTLDALVDRFGTFSANEALERSA
ncbi:MAG: helix-turn-helix domain-containing protein [Acidimicrobiales bacterium]